MKIHYSPEKKTRLPISGMPPKIQHIPDLIQKRINHLALGPGYLDIQFCLTRLTPAIPQSLTEARDFCERLEDSTVADIDFRPFFQIHCAGVLGAAAEDPCFALDSGCTIMVLVSGIYFLTLLFRGRLREPCLEGGEERISYECFRPSSDIAPV